MDTISMMDDDPTLPIDFDQRYEFLTRPVAGHASVIQGLSLRK